MSGEGDERFNELISGIKKVFEIADQVQIAK